MKPAFLTPLILLLNTAFVVSALAQDSSTESSLTAKSDLRVLYVGANPTPESQPDRRPTQSAPKHPERSRELGLNRPKAFQELLERFFNNVEIKASFDYEHGDSDNFDVTIFDEIPRFIKGQADHRRLPENFSGATITIGKVATRIVRNSKLEHL